MNEHAALIRDKAQTLDYEALRHPGTAQAAITWLTLAKRWAVRHRRMALDTDLECTIQRILKRIVEGNCYYPNTNAAQAEKTNTGACASVL